MLDKNLSYIQLKITICILNKLSFVEFCEKFSDVENGSSDLNPCIICQLIHFKLDKGHYGKTFNLIQTFSATVRSSTLIKNLTNAGSKSGGV